MVFCTFSRRKYCFLDVVSNAIQMNFLFLAMFELFQNHLHKNATFLKGSKLLLAVSGGIDSMVLTELFRKLEYDFAIAHCNFHLRGTESDQDEDFIRAYAEKSNITFHSITFDTEAFAKDNKLSIQVAARELRYAWFQELLAAKGYDYVLTAHHADDSLETFLINLSRGTGLEGMTGIPAQNENIIRPLLPFSRDAIEKYAKENHIQWREDSSNASDKYLRNKIRQDIVPILKSLNPAFLHSFGETLSHLQQSQSMVEDASNLVYKEVVIEKENKTIFKIFDLKRLPNYPAYLYHWLSPFGFTAWEDIYNLVDAQSGKQVFSKRFKLLKDREILILTPIENTDQTVVFPIEKNQEKLTFPINLSFCQVTHIKLGTDNCIFVDEDQLEFPLTLRKWQEGDYFYPFGMAGKKKISKFFKDEKYSLDDKNDAWILCSGNDIVWLIGSRMDDRFKVNNNTKHILQITTTQ
jgi:tRNA(Ile)-lysidine synthase